MKPAIRNDAAREPGPPFLVKDGVKLTPVRLSIARRRDLVESYSKLPPLITFSKGGKVSPSFSPLEKVLNRAWSLRQYSYSASQRPNVEFSRYSVYSASQAAR